MAELQHKTPRNPRRSNLRRLPGWHRTGEIFYAVGFLTEYWLICLGRKAAAAAHAARDAALYLIWLLLAPVLELGQAFCTALAGPHPLQQLVPWLAPCAAGVILWAVVAHGLNLHFTLQVEVNGTVVGSVATEQNFDTARADLQARLAAARQLADSDTAALPVLEPTYTLHIGGTPMTELQLTDAILRASGSSIVEGTAVYLDGSLVIPDSEAAMNWLHKASTVGYAPAQYALGKLLLSDDVSVHDSEAGIQWLEHAAHNGNHYASYRLGKEYLKGDSVRKDTRKAMAHIYSSAQAGNPHAQ